MSGQRRKAHANSHVNTSYAHLSLVDLLLQMLGLVLLLRQNATQRVALVERQLLRSIIHFLELIQVKLQFRDMLRFEVDLRQGK